MSVPMWHCRWTPSQPRDVAEQREVEAHDVAQVRRVGAEPVERVAGGRGVRGGTLVPVGAVDVAVVGHARIVSAKALGSSGGLGRGDARAGAPGLRGGRGTARRHAGHRRDGLRRVRPDRRPGGARPPRARPSSARGSSSSPRRRSTVVLFADASRIDLRALRRELSIPIRLLGLGLPLTLVAGTAAGVALFGEPALGRGAPPRGDPRADGRCARTGRRHARRGCRPASAGAERRERPERRDLRAALLHRPRRWPGRRPDTIGDGARRARGRRGDRLRRSSAGCVAGLPRRPSSSTARRRGSV